MQPADENLFGLRTSSVASMYLQFFYSQIFQTFNWSHSALNVYHSLNQLADSTVSRELLGFIRSTVVFGADAFDTTSGFLALSVFVECDETGFPSGNVDVMLLLSIDLCVDNGACVGARSYNRDFSLSPTTNQVFSGNEEVWTASGLLLWKR